MVACGPSAQAAEAFRLRQLLVRFRLSIELNTACLARCLHVDPGIGVIRHADAGYDEAIAAREQAGLLDPMKE